MPVFHLLSYFETAAATGLSPEFETAYDSGYREAYGLYDRGLIQTGFKADLNVIDFNNLKLRKWSRCPRRKRLVQRRTATEIPRRYAHWQVA